MGNPGAELEQVSLMNAGATTHEHEPVGLQTIPQAILFLMQRQGGKDLSALPWEGEPDAAVCPESAPDAAPENEEIVAHLLRAIEGTEIAARLGRVPPSSNGQPAVPVIAPPADSAESAAALHSVREAGPAMRPEPAPDAIPESNQSIITLLQAAQTTEVAASIDRVAHSNNADAAAVASVVEAETEVTRLALPQVAEPVAPAHPEIAPGCNGESDESLAVLQNAVSISDTVASFDAAPPPRDNEPSVLTSTEQAGTAEAAATLERTVELEQAAEPSAAFRATEHPQPLQSAAEPQPTPAAAPCEPKQAPEPLIAFPASEDPQRVQYSLDLDLPQATALCEAEQPAAPLAGSLASEVPQQVQYSLDLDLPQATALCEAEQPAAPLTTLLAPEPPQPAQSAVEQESVPAAVLCEAEQPAEPLKAFPASQALDSPIAVEFDEPLASAPSPPAELVQPLPIVAVPPVPELAKSSAKGLAAAATPLRPPASARNSALRTLNFTQLDTEKGSLAATAGLINEGLDRAEIQLERWFQKWFGPPDPRHSRRVTEPPLVAYHWIVDTPQALRIANISAGGLQLLTNERWSPGNIVSMTLQRTDRPKGSPESWIAVDFLVMRWCEDGMAGAFIASVPGLKNAVTGRAQNCADKRTLERFVEKLASPSYAGTQTMPAPASTSPSHSPA